MRSLRRVLGSPPTASDDPTAPAAASKLDNYGSKERNVLLVYYLGPYDNIVATTKIAISALLKPCFDKEVLRFLKLKMMRA
ncbi:hypothetical protein PF005_g8988 [Phytophthora fragariae]|uniref:Uncharacterized protein n=1 Tax=Phytophthora fragariae TaxID=53985 RepID=A0A6A3L6D5_9STRA|nr:hypothetical protein PF011_g7989 [Phytophthora fragariae]KAE9216620.1 hypothetical protein PF005_g8988 [Phytophthora fragariae]KAE9239330.1 hypothetical protein PF002_g10330 [Phytophthora fragariae]